MVDLEDDEDEEDEQPKRRGRPRPPWVGADTFTAGFRGVPAPHRGTQHVTADDTLGTLAECWCGLPFNHPWPGKEQGRKHPRGATMQTLDRTNLRGYNSTIADFVLHQIRVNGLKFRVKPNAILLYPPDETPPMSVYARNTDRQFRALSQWHQRHVEPFLPKNRKAVEEVDVAALAQKINDPVEHPLPPVVQEPEPVDEWHPYIGSAGDAIEGIVTNGQRYKCLLCEGTDHPMETENPRAIGGHRRIRHASDAQQFRDKSSENVAHASEVKAEQRAASGKHAFTPDDHRKQGQAKSQNAQKVRRMRVVLEQMCEAMDYYPADPNAVPEEKPQPDLPHSTADILRLESQVAELTVKAEEAEAKLALIREATGL